MNAERGIEWDVAVVRSNMLCELFGAELLLPRGVTVMQTQAQTALTAGQLEDIRDKRVLIAGGYYRGAMSPILDVARRVTVFLNSSDHLEPHPKLEVLRASIDSNAFGFASFCVAACQADGREPTAPNYPAPTGDVPRVARFLDEYLFGNPSEEALCFQNGVYTIDRPTDAEKIRTLLTPADVDRCVANGRPKRVSNLRIAEQRYKATVTISFRYGERDVRAVLGVGDSPIVDTCLFFAQKADVGMLFRFDVSQRRTFVSAISNAASNLDAGKLISDLFGGGGSFFMGGGSFQGLSADLEPLVRSHVQSSLEKSSAKLASNLQK